MTKKKRRTIGKKCNERIRKSRKMQWKGNNTHSHTHTLTPLLKGKWQFWCPSPVGSFNLWHRSFYYHLTWSLWHFPHFPPELTIVVILEENCSIWKLYPFIRASLPTHFQLSSAFSSSFLLFFAGEKFKDSNQKSNIFAIIYWIWFDFEFEKQSKRNQLSEPETTLSLKYKYFNLNHIFFYPTLFILPSSSYILFNFHSCFHLSFIQSALIWSIQIFCPMFPVYPIQFYPHIIIISWSFFYTPWGHAWTL